MIVFAPNEPKPNFFVGLSFSQRATVKVSSIYHKTICLILIKDAQWRQAPAFGIRPKHPAWIFLTVRKGAELSIKGRRNRGYSHCAKADSSVNPILLVSIPPGTHDDVITMLDTHLKAHDFAGFVNTASRVMQIDMFHLSVILMEQSGVSLLLLAIILGAPDPFIDRMQRTWSRPAPHEQRKRNEIDAIRRGLTPAMAGFILDSILAIAISEHSESTDDGADTDQHDDPEHALASVMKTK